MVWIYVVDLRIPPWMQGRRWIRSKGAEAKLHCENKLAARAAVE